jgi:hypothetical protein
MPRVYHGAQAEVLDRRGRSVRAGDEAETDRSVIAASAGFIY